MPKQYKTKNNVPMVVSEPAVAYRPKANKVDSATNWNPNVPFCGTQEEWWEHFHRIEEGGFMTLEEFDRKFETWKKEYLASKFKLV